MFDIFKIKYVGDEQENSSLRMAGLNLMDKTLSFGGARIAFRIWDVGGNKYVSFQKSNIQKHYIYDFNYFYKTNVGDKTSNEQVPIACKDAVAILFMFDLTSRCTLNK